MATTIKVLTFTLKASWVIARFTIAGFFLLCAGILAIGLALAPKH